jgi:ABC-2 type transport system permease protein
MTLISEQARAVVRAQWRIAANMYRGKGAAGYIIYIVFSVVWYGAWLAAGVFVVPAVARANPADLQTKILPLGLFAAMLWWQVVPLLLASSGAALDVGRLRVYPIRHADLFALEVLLRISTGLEVLIVLIALTIGLWLNPATPVWGPLALLPFIAFNMFLASGLRELLGRLMARKHIREIAVLAFVLLIASPQIIASSGLGQPIREFWAAANNTALPWVATARLTGGEITLLGIASLFAWTAAAWWFGRRQFEAGLRFDAAAARAGGGPRTRHGGLRERLYRLPRILPDPWAALIEKEARVLSRSPRFRLLFFMGFTFGVMIWFPMGMRSMRNPDSITGENFITLVSGYAVLIMSEALIWNAFGYDRSAAQVYLLAPMRFSAVLIAKNIVAITAVLAQVTVVSIVCRLVGLPVTAAKLLEAYAVVTVFLLYMLSAGNLSSVRYPKGVDPSQSWRSSGRGVYALFALTYPLAATPVGLAYLARYAFESELAFYGALSVAAAAAAAFYVVSLDSAAHMAHIRKEQMIADLSAGTGPIAVNV